jgi:hypothetical protein
VALPWHFLYFLPLPQGQGSFRPTFGSARRMGRGSPSPLPPASLAAAVAPRALPPPDYIVLRGLFAATGGGAAT